MFKAFSILAFFTLYFTLVAQAQEGNIPADNPGKIKAISRWEGTDIKWAECADSCHKLVEDGFSDWRMPFLNEAIYGRIAFAPPDGSWLKYIWTATPFTRAGGLWILMKEDNGNWDYRNYDNPSSSNGCRCVR